VLSTKQLFTTNVQDGIMALSQSISRSVGHLGRVGWSCLLLY